ncbi:MAG TPA: lysine 2,3-aminomutase, partial [Desulfuromonadales bacterium]|nr:lysine 2,3-aminomutase [Desulfuromonadales bacterium]
MPIFSNAQQEIADRMSVGKVALSKWTDWKWQMRNCIKSVDQFETLLGIELEEKQRKKIELTIKKFPLSITPYYLSLINAEDYQNDPTFLQAFPAPAELEIHQNDMADPLAEDQDSPAP